jgi:HNH endonuclease
MGRSGLIVTKPVYCDAVPHAQSLRRVHRVIGLSWFLFRSEERFVKVLKLSAQGLPQSWISLEQAVIHYASDEVRWEVGAQVAVFRGGHNAVTGQQSQIAINSIIGTKGVPRINPFAQRPGLTNSKLFARDRNICAYCGGHFHEDELTREHIIPFAQKGIDTWMNVVTACRPCNHRKSSRTPEQAGMALLYAPYVPSLWEDFILRNRRILADQMEFLMAHLPQSSRLHG